MAGGALRADPRPVEPPQISPPDSWIATSGGVLRVLNKVDTRVTRTHIAVGQTVQVEKLSITLVGCYVRPPDLPQDATAHVKIKALREDATSFEGWLLKEEPSMTMFEDPIFDVHVDNCG